MSLQRWKLTIEYYGSDFSGWQRQRDSIPSVQKSIEDAITAFCQKDIHVHAAGRTDAGVHASGQVAHFDLDYGDRPLSGFTLTKALNAHLRFQKISILQAEPVEDDFHARFSATNKLYTYRVCNRFAPPSIDHSLVWHVGAELDCPLMRQASRCLIGYHDFTTFRATACQAKSPFRTLSRLDIETIPLAHGGQEIRFLLEGKSFLHHQVRNIVGTLILVGKHKWSVSDVQEALDAKDRSRGGETAPPDGLFLSRIDY